MKVLLVNDDGVYAEGIHSLRRALAARGVSTYISAPERERSAMGHAITLHKPLHVNAVHVDEQLGPAWAVSGTPADCTKIGVQALLPERPDLVIAGINRGANVGMDVLYSGTVSAAIEGVILGVPSLAVSLAGYDDLDFEAAAQLTAGLVARLGSAPLPDRPYLLNVNLPVCPPDKLAGVAMTRLGVRQYTDVFHPRRDPRGRLYYWLAGEPRDESETPNTDVWALSNNYVSITPLRFELTDDPLLEALRPWADTLLPAGPG